MPCARRWINGALMPHSAARDEEKSRAKEARDFPVFPGLSSAAAPNWAMRLRPCPRCGGPRHSYEHPPSGAPSLYSPAGMIPRAPVRIQYELVVSLNCESRLPAAKSSLKSIRDPCFNRFVCAT
jgi:hypothetical protein